MRVQKYQIYKKYYICSCKYSKYLASIIDNSMITCDEIIDAEAKSYDEETRTVIINFNEKKMQFVKQKISIFYLPFY